MAAPAQSGYLRPANLVGRDLGAAIIGLWYWITLGSGLSEGIRMLAGMPGNNGWVQHYLLFAIASVMAAGLAAALAASAAPHPRIVGLFVAAPLPLVVILLAVRGAAGFSARLPVLAFGYAPTAFAFIVTWAVATIGIGIASGFAVGRENSGRSSPWLMLDVRAGHWCWLWIPSWFWTASIAPLVYVVWLDFILGWHWLIHPSLWISWQWWVYGMFGIGLTWLPYNLFFAGIAGAIDSLTSTDRSSGAVLGRFLGFGVGISIIGVSLALTLAFWIFARLPIVATHAPWWAPF